MPVNTIQVANVVLSDTFTQFANKTNEVISIVNGLPGSLSGTITRIGGTVDGVDIGTLLTGDLGNIYIINQGKIGVGDYLGAGEPTAIPSEFSILKTSASASINVTSATGYANLALMGTDDGTGGVSVRFLENSNQTGMVFHYDGSVGGTPGYGQLDLRNSSSGVEETRFSFTRAGYFGIGTTTPYQPLHVKGISDTPAKFESTDAYSGIMLKDNSATGQWSLASYKSGAGADTFRIRLYNAAGSYQLAPLTITSSGFMGIGSISSATDLPITPLEILHADYTMIKLRNLSTEGDPNIGFYNNNSTDAANFLGSVGANDPGLSGGVADRTMRLVAPGAADGTVSFWTWDTGTTWTEKMRIARDGKVGIGASTFSAALNPLYKLHVKSGDDHLALFESTDTYAGILLRDNSATAPTWALASYGDFFRVRQYNASMVFQGERLVISSSGKVGIGTTGPQQLLHVKAGRIRISEATKTGFDLSQESGGHAYLINHDNGHMIFQTNATERMRIESGGDVGIGTNNPTSKLHVLDTTVVVKIDDAAAGGSPRLDFSQAGTRRSYIQHVDSGDGLILSAEYGSMELKTGTGGSPASRLVLKNDGNVYIPGGSGNFGIGGATPTKLLHVYDNTASETTAYARIEHSSNRRTTLNLLNTSGSWEIRGVNGANRLDFYNGPTNSGANAVLMSLLTSGRLGIGATSPADMLHIVGGDIRLDDTVAGQVPTFKLVGPYSTSGNARDSGQIGWYSGSVTNYDTPGEGGAAAVEGGIVYVMKVTEQFVNTADRTATFELRDRSKTGGATTNATRLFIDTVGKVGIGTAGPVKKLHVTESATNNDDGYIRMEHTGAYDAGINFLTAGGSWSLYSKGASGTPTNRFDIYNASNPNSGASAVTLSILPDPANRGSLYGHANVVIGDTGVGFASLTVRGDIWHTGKLYDSLNTSFGGEDEVLTSDGAGKTEWQALSAIQGQIGGSGTQHYIPKWTTTGAIGDSVIRQIAVTGETQVKVAGSLHVGATSSANLTVSSNLDDGSPYTMVQIQHLGHADEGGNNDFAKLIFDESTRDQGKFWIQPTDNFRAIGEVSGGSTSDIFHIGDYAKGIAAFKIDGAANATVNGNFTVAVKNDSKTDPTQPASMVIKKGSINSSGGSVLTEYKETGVGGNIASSAEFSATDYRFYNTYDKGLFIKSGAATRVGLGTESPEQFLHIEAGRIRLSEAGKTGFDIAQESGGHAYIINHDAGGHIFFFTEGQANEDKVMTITNGGRVGIGNVTPAELLHVYGDDAKIRLQDTNGNNSRPEIQFYQETVDSSSIYHDGAAAEDKLTLWSKVGGLAFNTGASTTERMTILSTGHVGIGTTTPTGARLHIKGAAHESLRLENAGGSTAQPYISYYDGSTRLGYSGVTAGGLIVASEAPNEGIGLATKVSGGSLTTRLSIKNDGDIGIGTTSPLYKLHVKSAEGPGAADNLALFESTDTYAGIVLRDNSSTAPNWGLASYGDSFRVRQYNASMVAQGDRLVISSSGHVGIGTTDPKVKLHIVGGTGIATAITEAVGYLVLGSTGSINLVMDDNEIQARNNGAVSSMYLQKNGGIFNVGTATHGSGGIQRGLVWIDTVGRLGINKSSPAYTLDIYGSLHATGDVKFPFTTPSSTTTTGVLQLGGGLGLLGNLNAGGWLAATNDITTTAGDIWAAAGDIYTTLGKIGVKTTTPAYDLDVVGTARVSDVTRLTSTSSATTATTGALRVTGGISTQENFVAGGTIQSTGRVGIGNVTPAELLHVYGSAAKIRLQDSSSSDSSPELQFWMTATHGSSIYHDGAAGLDNLTLWSKIGSGGGISFKTNTLGTQRMAINDSIISMFADTSLGGGGRLGINTLAAAHGATALTVNSSVYGVGTAQQSVVYWSNYQTQEGPTEATSGNLFYKHEMVVRDHIGLSASTNWTQLSYMSGLGLSNVFGGSSPTAGELKSWIKQNPYEQTISFGSSGTSTGTGIAANTVLTIHANNTVQAIVANNAPYIGENAVMAAIKFYPRGRIIPPGTAATGVDYITAGQELLNGGDAVSGDVQWSYGFSAVTRMSTAPGIYFLEFTYPMAANNYSVVGTSSTMLGGGDRSGGDDPYGAYNWGGGHGAAGTTWEQKAGPIPFILNEANSTGITCSSRRLYIPESPDEYYWYLHDDNEVNVIVVGNPDGPGEPDRFTTPTS